MASWTLFEECIQILRVSMGDKLFTHPPYGLEVQWSDWELCICLSIHTLILDWANTQKKQKEINMTLPEYVTTVMLLLK